tara:strand:- start:23639 stop:25015 length:1377 start_codon:yes stop_codon:yes gene_type:complete
MLKQHERSISTAQRIFDAILIYACWMAAYFIRFDLLPNADRNLFEQFAKIGLIQAAFALYFMHKNGLYRSQRFNSRVGEILTVLKANSLAFVALVIGLYFVAPERVSRGQLLLYFPLSTVALVALRLIARNFLRALRKRGKNLRHVLLIGNGPQLCDYVETARRYKDCGIHFRGWINSSGLAAKQGIQEITVDYEAFRSQENVDVIVIGHKNGDHHKTEEFLRSNYNDITPIQILPDLSYAMVGQQVEDFAGIPLITYNQPQFSTIDLMIKRFFDFTLTLIGLIIISPLLIFIAIGVKLTSPGPIFYGQRRMGIDGQLFTMWKFRSMRMASDDSDTKEWSNKENPRKTKFGAFLRKTSLDELPQLFNVLLGQMSLVGPRPEQPFFVEKFRSEIPGYMLRHKMKAGITGWAQVNGWRGDTSLKKRIECDIYYIKHWNLWFDVKILFLTFWKGFIDKNAY